MTGFPAVFHPLLGSVVSALGLLILQAFHRVEFFWVVPLLPAAAAAGILGKVCIDKVWFPLDRRQLGEIGENGGCEIDGF